ncbi:glucosaminidase domain-containing protein [Candidatus Gracilibacteria bacterium]|nr:glucosaminidase domain-containing protein [Candidatus Gracilibacteria bacterium]
MTINPEKQYKDTISTRVTVLQEELAKNPKNPENAKIRGEIAELRRELNRTKQFTNIGKEGSKKIAENKNMDSLSAAELMRIDQEEGSRGEFLSKSFLYKQTTDTDGNIFQEPTDGKSLKEGDILYVDFGKNRSAEGKIGTGDMIPMTVKVVKIIDTAGKIRMGKRSIQGGKVGYYDEQGYIAVYNGFKIEIPKKNESEEYIIKSNQSIKVNNTEEQENSAKDEFIEVAQKYDALGSEFTPWNILEKKQFQEKSTEVAKAMETKYGIPWQVTYTQSTLETGYGRSAPNNNYFGIKGGSSGLKTKEFINGKETEVIASFRGYSSMEESFDDYGKLLTTNPRYQNAFKFKNNPELFLGEIIRAGYATDPEYVSKAKRIWTQYDSIRDFNVNTPELVAKTTPDALIQQASKYIGTEYVWGGNTEYGIDCSHLVCKSLSDLGASKKSFYRVAADLRGITPHKPMKDVVKGDLIFWHSGSNGVSHVAIALNSPKNGNLEILDASGKTSGAGKVSTREVPISTKLSAGTPPFYS